MLDFSQIQNYYIACGYTDMRKQINGLAAVVELQFHLSVLWASGESGQVTVLGWHRLVHLLLQL